MPDLTMPDITMPDVTLLKSDEIAKSRQPLSKAWSLPSSAYTKPDIFEDEKKLIFDKEWQCVARVEQVANVGDYVCVDLPNQPIVITHTQNNELKAISRICLHRAMPISEGSGNTTKFTCPYHHWTYELDGSLRSAPMMEGADDFKTEKCRLPELRLEAWHGFIFVNLNNEAQALAPQLKRVSELIDNYAFEDMVIAESIEFDSPWNWKILIENFMEAYHHIGTHKDTFEPIYKARDSYIEENDGRPFAILRMPGKDAYTSDNPLPAFPNLTEQQKQELLAITVFPSFIFAASATMGIWYQLEIKDYKQMQLKIHVLLRPETQSQLSEDDRLAIRDSLHYIHSEDIPANEGPWKGHNASLTEQGRLSPYEKAIWQFNQWWLDRITHNAGHESD